LASQIDSTVDDQKPAILAIVAKNIIETRKELGLTQEQLAHKAGVDRSYMGYIENAKHNVSIGMLERIAVALETSVSTLTSKESKD